MPESPDIDILVHKLNLLLQRQAAFGKEIAELRHEISLLKTQPGIDEPLVTRIERPTVVEPPETASIPAKAHQPFASRTEPIKQAKARPSMRFQGATEKFIGENLISKIGIGITIIGVGIGAKYAIDKDLISPLLRIILGYLVGFTLLFFAARLKKKYESFSAVLFSGGMAILFLITFFAYSFYGLFALPVGFALMVLITMATVWGALHYNQPLIAHIGLVGAYTVPFLLGDEDGKAAILFGYMSVINTGILVIAFQRYWKSLYYVAFVFSWFIFLFWQIVDYQAPQDFNTYFTFAIVFFGIFYLTFLAYKLIKKETFGWLDILLILANSFIFYGLGYILIADLPNGASYLGVFTLANALVHAAAGGLVYRNGFSDPALVRFLLGLALVFITVAVPVQLDGSWVTVLWAMGATVLMTIGIQRKINFYFLLGFPLMVLALGSLAEDWMNMYDSFQPEDPSSRVQPIMNLYFLVSWLVAIAFGWISYSLWKKPSFGEKALRPFRIIVPAMFLLTLYYTFQIEISTYWRQLYLDSNIQSSSTNDYLSYLYNPSIRLFGQMWELNYTLFFFAVLSLVNLRLFKNRTLGYINQVLNLIGLVLFLSQGLYLLSELRELYLDPGRFTVSTWALNIRYVSFLFFGFLLWASYRYTRAGFMKWQLQIPFELFLHLSFVWILSSELIHWQDLAGAETAYKIGLSILWGAYALLLIMLGIWKRKAHLRFAAIGLFAVTLVKLFFYDLTNLNTLSKTIVMVSLGAFLLIISFLYNKYAAVIEGERGEGS